MKIDKNDWLMRTKLLAGEEAVERIRTSEIAVFGLGGVGSYACEAVCRAGTGRIFICDDDTVDVTNINRQLIADTTTVGMRKVDVEAERIMRINPNSVIIKEYRRFDETTAGSFPFGEFDYVIDAIDSIDSKLLLIKTAHEAGVPIISAMGGGSKLDPSQLEYADIADTSYDPLARSVRQKLRKMGIYHTKVVYSRESPKRSVPYKDAPYTASISFVPPAAGFMLAAAALNDIMNIPGEQK
ncbi:MAG: tRNA threonylcarbamoyladenosine dehydratase [Eubacteriales bacterium]|nr:tRNA threonylcarbamoyladenosine dehydratase [Eubacteriales bacterium]